MEHTVAGLISQHPCGSAHVHLSLQMENEFSSVLSCQSVASKKKKKSAGLWMLLIMCFKTVALFSQCSGTCPKFLVFLLFTPIIPGLSHLPSSSCPLDVLCPQSFSSWHEHPTLKHTCCRSRSAQQWTEHPCTLYQLTAFVHVLLLPFFLLFSPLTPTSCLNFSGFDPYLS